MHCTCTCYFSSVQCWDSDNTIEWEIPIYFNPKTRKSIGKEDDEEKRLEIVNFVFQVNAIYLN